MSEPPICPCEGFTHPQVIFNLPGRDLIVYRVGNYTTFRRALLLPLKDSDGKIQEYEISNWHPTAQGDLGLQMMEWWAYLADILTFYNERIATQAYLRTADLPESVQRLIRILGYRPRPGIGAQGFVAALMTDPTKSFTLPKGFPIQSKPSPGKQPQIFELDADTKITDPDAVAADAVPDPHLTLAPSHDSVLLKDAVTTVEADDALLVLAKDWNASDSNYALVTVKEVQLEKDPQGKVNTRVVFTQALPLPVESLAANYRLVKSAQSAHVWLYPANSVIQNNQVDLEAIARTIKAGDPVLFEVTGNHPQPPDPQLVSVTDYGEAVWYANAPDPAHPETSPSPRTTPPIPIPHTRLGFVTPANFPVSDFNVYKSSVLVYYAYQDVGVLIGTPAAIVTGTPTRTPDQTKVNLSAVNPGVFPPLNKVQLFVEDTNSQGVLARGDVSSEIPSAIQLTISTPPESLPSLKPPLRVLFDLLPVSRGETVSNEILGSGDASIAGQKFVLQKSPLTYLLSGDSTSGSSYKSTLQIWVNQVEWKEAPSFYGQAGNATIFVTREDESNKTHVQFGDGVNGARLPSGVNNVVATYRHGSGKDAPEAGTLSVITKPYPNLQAIRNPVPVGGGADPDPPQQIRRYGPQSVLTFGRAVSGDDYETIAAQAPGVARAKAYWTWDSDEQRTLVLIYVGDDASAVNSARVAVRNAADPNRLVKVKQAIAIPIHLTLTLRIDSNYITDTVVTATRSALLDADTGLFGVNNIQIGQSIYQSQIYSACQRVSGVVAVHGLQFTVNTGIQPLRFPIHVSFPRVFDRLLLPHYRHDPGEGKFYQLSTENLITTSEVI